MPATLKFHNRTLVIADSVMEHTLKLASRAAKSSSAVLLCGESGTGKELIARYLHESGPRSSGAFITVNCAAIPDGLMEAELFGYERGAFTGAVMQRLGKFELANGGTLLLDEVSEMSINLQAKLLRVLQEGEIDRLGGKKVVPINSRIIATTNREPQKLILEQKFREDLYYRLNVLRIECSPLRGRVDAILNLAEAFLAALKERDGMAYVLSESAKRRLVEYQWPGNIRELKNAMERAVFVSDGATLLPQHFDALNTVSMSADVVEADSLFAIEKQHILHTLDRVGGNRSHAAARLGITSRTLRNKLKEYGS